MQVKCVNNVYVGPDELKEAILLSFSSLVHPERCLQEVTQLILAVQDCEPDSEQETDIDK